MGRILKNRAGSLEKNKLKEIFSNAMEVHLRFLTFFFDLIKNETLKNEMIKFINSRVLYILREKKQKNQKKGEGNSRKDILEFKFFSHYVIHFKSCK